MCIEPSNLDGYATLVVHVEPADSSTSRRSHWSTRLIPVEGLIERLQRPDALLSDLFPMEEHENGAARSHAS